jgi:hypothetical protein
MRIWYYELDYVVMGFLDSFHDRTYLRCKLVSDGE